MTQQTAKRILFVFGTRPEAIKMAPIILQARARSELQVLVCITAQHRQMLDQVLDLFQIRADFDLNLMKPGQTLVELTCDVLQGCTRVMESTRPDLVIVHGDTSTCLSASLAAYYCRIPVAHVEAGLRTGELFSPWPEEGNRRLTGALAGMHFAPTERAKANLLREGVPESLIHVTGNTVIDALHLALQRIQGDPSKFPALGEVNRLLQTKRRLILVTGHRRENFGEGLVHICEALRALARRTDVQIIYPVHLNPSIQEPVRSLLGEIDNIELLPPQDYLPFVYLLSKAELVLTDSGGVQEEAPALGKPVLIMRDFTERPEAVEAGTARLVGTTAEMIERTVLELLDDPLAYRRMAQAHSPYGDGQAARRIVEVLCANALE